MYHVFHSNERRVYKWLSVDPIQSRLKHLRVSLHENVNSKNQQSGRLFGHLTQYNKKARQGSHGWFSIPHTS